MLQTGMNKIESHFLQPFLFSCISLYFCLSIYICGSFMSIESKYYCVSHFHHLYSLGLKGLFYWGCNEYILINMYQANGDLSCFTTIELKIANTVGMDWFVIWIIAIVFRIKYSWFLFDRWLIGLILIESFYSLLAQ